MIEKFVRHNHLDKEYGYLPGMSSTLVATLYGLDEQSYSDLLGQFNSNAREAAQQLLSDPAIHDAVQRLPFEPGATVLGIGDSLTSDRQSWLEILRHLLDLTRPSANIRVVNAGASGHTTAMILRRIVPTLLSTSPDWILCCLGGNDVTRIGPEPTITQVSVSETARNLAELQRLGTSLTNARWVWMTPASVDEERVSAFAPFKQGQSTWRNTDVTAIADVVRSFAGPVVDVQAALGLPPDPNLQGADGVHPSLAGQSAIAKALITTLTTAAPRTDQ